FTLIELLIVIAIIAVLAATIIAATGSARKQARDARRTQDLDALKQALELYYDDYKAYPYDSTTESTGKCIDEDADFASALADYISQVPKDPQYSGGYEHCYYYVTSDSGQKFKLFVMAEQSDFKAAKEDGGTENCESDEECMYEVYSINPGSAQLAFSPNQFYFSGGGVSGVYIDRYEASRPDATSSSAGSNSSKADSKSNVVVWTNINFTDAKANCDAAEKHLITMTEWGSIARWSKDNTTMPGGHNLDNWTGSPCKCEKGEDIDGDTAGTQTCSKDPTSSTYCRCLTGSGKTGGSPEYAWTHNHQSNGIWDLNGNVWEWVDFEGQYGYVTNGLWWRKDEGTPGNYDAGDEVYVIVPANHTMKTTIEGSGGNVDALIADPEDKNENGVGGGAAAWISSVSDGDCLSTACTIVITNPIGDIDQFRDGDGSNYGDGFYWFQVSPVYTGTDWNNTSTIFKCNSYDPIGQTFSGCLRNTGVGGGGDERTPAVGDVITSIVKENICGSGDWYHCGYINSLRGGALSDMAIPGSISGSASADYGSDYYWGRPYGSRAALRGANWSSGSRAGVFALYLLNAPVYSFVSIGFRCAQ
ncbi:prepilin-type N-terminal cleavage/methylation domain-containing protein, partial [bacterium]|nr:prepilin-type N-terminal cleavage/methylation domain-containing protein [bacterium]